MFCNVQAKLQAHPAKAIDASTLPQPSPPLPTPTINPTPAPTPIPPPHTYSQSYPCTCPTPASDHAWCVQPDLHGIVPVVEGQFTSLQKHAVWWSLRLRQAAAVCNSLTFVRKNRVVGDGAELKLCKAVEAHFVVGLSPINQSTNQSIYLPSVIQSHSQSKADSQMCLVIYAGAVLCCAVLCCAVLCCAVLCCAVLRCAVLCCAGRLGFAVLHQGVLCYWMPPRALCY